MKTSISQTVLSTEKLAGHWGQLTCLGISEQRAEARHDEPINN